MAKLRFDIDISDHGIPSERAPLPKRKDSYLPDVSSPLSRQPWTPDDAEEDEAFDNDSHWSYKSISGLSSVSDRDDFAEPPPARSATPIGLGLFSDETHYGRGAFYQPPTSSFPPPNFSEVIRGPGYFDMSFEEASAAADKARNGSNSRFFNHYVSRTDGSSETRGFTPINPTPARSFNDGPHELLQERVSPPTGADTTAPGESIASKSPPRECNEPSPHSDPSTRN